MLLLSDTDIFGSASFEEPDLLGEATCSLGNEKFVVFSGDHDFASVLHNWFLEQSLPISFQISSFDSASVILRC